MTHMTDDLLDTRTLALWESVVIQRTGITIPVDTGLMTNSVQLIRRYSRLDMSSRQIQDFSCELPSAQSIVAKPDGGLLTRQTFLMPSISSFVRIFTLLSLTASHWENPCAIHQLE
jgi:hypothetical protein